MQTVLAAIGVIALGIIVALVVGFFWIRHKFGQLLNLPQVMSSTTISMLPESDPEWMDEAHMSVKTEEFHNLGFETFGVYRIPELNETLLKCFYREQDRVVGIITEMPGAAINEEVGVQYSDGSAVDFCTSPMIGKLEPRPGQEKFSFLNFDCQMLLEQLGQYDDAGRERKPVTRQGIAQDIEEAYAKDMAWLLGRGGPTKAEVRKISGDVENEEVIEDTYRIQREQYIAQCRDLAVQSWATQNDMTPHALDDMEEFPVVINEFMTRDEILEAFEDEWHLTVEQIMAIKKLGSADQIVALVFVQRFSEIFPDSGYERVAKILEPVPAYLFGIKAQQSVAA